MSIMDGFNLAVGFFLGWGFIIISTVLALGAISAVVSLLGLNR
jgi:hypothetical protein